MPSWIVDMGVVVLILLMTYALTSEGLWGAALVFFNILFAGLITFNFYEPLAALLASNVSQISGYADTLCLMVLFIVSLTILKITTEQIAPSMVRFPTPVYHIGRLFFGLAGASLAMAILLLAFHTSPIHKKMFYGAYNYDHKPPFGFGLDWKWLSFFQYTTGQVFAQYDPEDGYNDPNGEYGDAKLFDPQGRWLIDHQNARPYGDAFVPPPPAAEPAGEAGGAEGAGGMPGGMPGGSPGGPPGGSPTYPGGPTGAAAGMAPL